MSNAAPTDISNPRLDPDQFYARLGKLFAEMMGPMIAQRIRQLMAHRKLEEAVAPRRSHPKVPSNDPDWP